MHQPYHELMLSRTGALLCSGKARYDTLAEYAAQFPDREKLGAFWRFVDPCQPDRIIILSLIEDESPSSLTGEGCADRVDLMSAVSDGVYRAVMQLMASPGGWVRTRHEILEAIAGRLQERAP